MLLTNCTLNLEQKKMYVPLSIKKCKKKEEEELNNFAKYLFINTKENL